MQKLTPLAHPRVGGDARGNDQHKELHRYPLRARVQGIFVMVIVASLRNNRCGHVKQSFVQLQYIIAKK